MKRNDYAEFGQYLALLLDGGLSESQAKVLEKCLAEDAGLRGFYIEYIKIHTLLHRELDGRNHVGIPIESDEVLDILTDEVEADPVAGISQEPYAQAISGDAIARAGQTAGRISAANSPKPSNLIRYCSIAASFLLVATVLFWAAQQFGDHRPAIAKVTDSRDAVWVDTSDSGLVANPQSLPIGEYDLRAGQLEITFNDGTIATLDAPTRFGLTTDNSIHLTRGSVYVIAEEGTSGFRVSTPDALAVDLGTEYGVRYTHDFVTDVHVFKGAVNISSTDYDAEGRPQVVGEVVKLTAGQSGTVTSDAGPVAGSRADAGLFVRTISAQADAASSPTYQSWLAYRDRLRMDPDLIATYDFRRRGHAPRTLINIASTTGSRLNGVLGDGAEPISLPQWSTGRFPGSQSLLFTPSYKQFVELPDDEALKIRGDLTTVWWMMPRNTINRDFSMVILGSGAPRLPHAPETAYENHVYAHGLKKGRIRAFHESGEGDNQEALSSIQVESDRWTHVAIVRDVSEKTYHIYVNGVLSDTLAYRSNITGGESPESRTTIGRSGGAKLNHYDGKLDELMIYARALSEAEVTNLYHRSRPGN